MAIGAMDVPGGRAQGGGAHGCRARRAPLRPAFVKLHLVDCPHGALYVLDAHETFVERQVVSDGVLSKHHNKTVHLTALDRSTTDLTRGQSNHIKHKIIVNKNIKNNQKPNHIMQSLQVESFLLVWHCYILIYFHLSFSHGFFVFL